MTAELARPALHGGAPASSRFLPYGRQDIDEEDIARVVEVLRSDWITTGPLVEAFEEAFAARVGARHAVSFTSGTAGLHAAVFAAGLGPGDEAVSTPLTFCATANAVLFQGGTPRFADVEEDTLCLDPRAASEALTERTRAVLPVDFAGQPADLEAFRDLADRHGLVVIEDACHALGAELNGRQTGSLADLTVFSFHPVKHITTGEGGMVTTRDDRLAARLRLFRNHGIASGARERQEQGRWFYEMVALGYNYRLPDLACALGVSQLRKLDSYVARRREIAQAYGEAFRDLPEVREPTGRAGSRSSWHLYPIRLVPERLRVDRAEVFRALRAENLGVNVHYIPVHYHPYYRERLGDLRGRYPVAEAAYETLISLPLHPGLGEEDVRAVIEAVRKVVAWYRAS